MPRMVKGYSYFQEFQQFPPSGVTCDGIFSPPGSNGFRAEPFRPLRI